MHFDFRGLKVVLWCSETIWTHKPPRANRLLNKIAAFFVIIYRIMQHVCFLTEKIKHKNPEVITVIFINVFRLSVLVFVPCVWLIQGSPVSFIGAFRLFAATEMRMITAS